MPNSKLLDVVLLALGSFLAIVGFALFFIADQALEDASRTNVEAIREARGAGAAAGFVGIGLASLGAAALVISWAVEQGSPRQVYERWGKGPYMWRTRGGTGQEHTVAFKKHWPLGGTILLDGATVWRGFFLPTEGYRFDIDGEPAVLSGKSHFWHGLHYQLTVAGRLIE